MIFMNDFVSNALKSIYQHPMFTTSQLSEIFSGHEKVSFLKGEHLLNQGEVSNHYYIIEKGLIRSYLFNYKGDEITTQFFTDNEIVNEVASFFQRVPTQFNLQALTETSAWRIDFDTFQQYYHSMDSVAEWGRLWMTNQLFESQNRHVEMITESATSRYLKLLETKPKIIQHSPLKQIASYLGITDTSLSRIRKEVAK